AGLIGGIERYIAGTYWGIGSFTRVACSVSTCLAGFLTPVLHRFVFRRKKPSAVYAFFTGAVIEVFHMYAVFATHRDDMDMAFSVVRTCATPMILFTGLGLAASSVGLQMQAGEWRNPLRRLREEDVPVSQKFQFWLFAVTSVVLLINFALSYAVQTQIAIQHTRDTLSNVSEDIKETYIRITDTLTRMTDFTEDVVLMEARAIAEAVEAAADNDMVDEVLLEDLRSIYGLESVTLVGSDGKAKMSAGYAPVYAKLLSDVLSGHVASELVNVSDVRTIAGSRCLDGMIQVVINPEALLDRLNVADISEALSFFHVGNTGAFDIIFAFDSDYPGVVMVGDHNYDDMTLEETRKLLDAPIDRFFVSQFFGVDAVCMKLALEDDILLLTQLPLSEVYSSRDIKTYEYAFAGILLFAVIYTLVSMLVQRIVVNNLQLVNASLTRITGGDLNEVVDVRSAKEFAFLSDDINQTVDVLKSYIGAAEKRIEQELEFARTIQESTLPRRFDFPRNDFEIFATMDPAREVGGDFYDFFFVAMERVALVIADVSGKGIPAALFMMRAKTTIRAQAERGLAPAEI
ncbi:MAG: LytS/YhcK type 5TM receptor domain-containing protein, partial [bacterium]